MIKLLADGAPARSLGGGGMAPDGTNSMYTLAMALKAGKTAQALGETHFAYLTTAEGLKRAAQTCDKDIAKMSCCTG